MGKKPNMHTLCWTCRNAVGRCSWAKKGKPVDGWEATETKLVARKGTSGRMKWQGENAYTHIIHEITDEKKREELLEAEAHQDTLTHIGNRYFFREKAQEVLTSNENVTFCYCDLDHLKYINDKYGHIEGDWYLTFFVETVKRHIRKGDIFARLGGDEFCIILPRCPKKQAELKMQQVFLAFFTDTSRPYQKSFSYGIVEIPKNHSAIQVEDIIEQADAMMYKQKRMHHRETERT